MNMDDLARKLEAVGLDRAEADVYLRLLHAGPTKVGRLTQFFECSRSTLYRRLDELVEEGVVEKSLGSPTVYESVSPSALFEEREATLSQHHERLRRAREDIQGALETLAGDADTDRIEHQWVKMEGMGRIFGMVHRITQEAEESICVASNHETALARNLPDVDHAWEELDRKAREDNLDVRLLVDVGQAPFGHLPDSLGEGSRLQARALDVDQTLQFFLVDGRKLVTWLRPTPPTTIGQTDDVALFTDAPGSLTPHNLLFERLWEESKPLDASEGASAPVAQNGSGTPERGRA